MCYFHWLIKKLPWLLIGQQLRQVEQTEQNAGKKESESDAMTLLSETDVGQNTPGKPHGDTQIIRNGLDQYVRVSQ